MVVVSIVEIVLVAVVVVVKPQPGLVNTNLGPEPGPGAKKLAGCWEIHRPFLEYLSNKNNCRSSSSKV